MTPPPLLPNSPAGSIVSLESVTKHFGRRVALDSVTLDVPAGSISGLLGHNGAGKSTLIGLLLGQIFPDSGRITVDGNDVGSRRAEALQRVGAIYETPAFYGHLSGRRNLGILCEYTGPVPPSRLEEVIQVVGLSDRIDDAVECYSHGMRQRLALAQALLPNPKLLILDEPTEGLDPEGIFETRELIRKLNREWKLSIIVSSHQLSELEQICDHLAVLREGQLLFSGDWRKSDPGTKSFQFRVDRQSEAEDGLKNAGLLARDRAGGMQLTEQADLTRIAAWLVENGFRIESLGCEEKSLEAFYLETTRHGARTGDTK